MPSRPILPVLALGFLLAVSASAQHHHVMGGKVDYDPDPSGGDPNPPEGCQGVQAKINISSNGTIFSPATITVDAGQPVCWTWSGTSSTHNVKADDGSFTSGPPGGRGNFQRTFDTPGTYSYHCQVHGSPTAGMRGTVVVRSSSSGGEGPGKLEIASTAYTVSEGAGALTVTVERVDGSDGAASVKFATTAGTAKRGKDFNPRTGTLRWANGDQTAKTFEVPIKNDTAREQDESFTVKLSKATGATIATSSAVVTIQDDDGAGCGAALTAPSKLRALGQSDSEIRLTWADEPAAASAFRIERRPEGGTFQEIASVAAGANRFTDSGLPGGTVFHYRVRAEGAEGLSAFSALAAGATDGPATPCGDARKALCLQGGRFEATVAWSPSEGEAGIEAKRVVLPEAPGSGLFSLSPEEDLQLLVNVRNGCAVNDHFWLDFAAVTDVEVTVKVRDTRTGRTWVYFNPAGQTPAAMRDVDAFATCP
ncbi:MAG TPA: Calx-beta domain-containing protein [Thermoanaerobaculia bacterium]|nr:Calx-beta domain-containing protein [Thermoanaerobaculia bacterium]